MPATTSAALRRRVVAALLTGVLALTWSAPPGSAEAAATVGIEEACEGAPGEPSFRDVAGLPAQARAAIGCLVGYGITFGYGDGTYRPGEGVRRSEMALFLARILELAEDHGTVALPETTAEPGFEDTGDLPEETRTAIGLLAELEVATGTSAQAFSPHREVNRRDMARFLVRLQAAALDPDVGYAVEDLEGVDADFADVDKHEAYPGAEEIYALAEAGIVGGHADGTYRPYEAVSRSQMAHFLARLLADNVAAGRLPPVAEITDPEPEPVTETVVDGLAGPWGAAWLPDGRLAVTESEGALGLVDVDRGEVATVEGVPEVDTGGQGGLLDVAVEPGFEDGGWLYLTYAGSDGEGARATHLARGRLDIDEGELTDLEVLFVAEPFRTGTSHYGSRVVFGEDGRVYLTLGDRGDKRFDDHVAQDTSNTLGSTVRLEPDGSVPDDNPFVDDPDVHDAIFSYGHRNAQGMAVHPFTGELWQSEHGERDGDEINVVERGGNHGWPVAHTGCRYGTDEPLGDDPFERDDVVDPVLHWPCGSGGFPPAGIAFVEGGEFPAWEGDLLVGGLASRYLARFTIDERGVVEAEPLLEDEGWRIRDVTVEPDSGVILVLTDEGRLVRLRNDR